MCSAMVDAAPPILVCHRGASALAPENTLEAFRVAMQYGMDFSELDVFVSRAGEILRAELPDKIVLVLEQLGGS